MCVINVGDLVNIDVFVLKDGFFVDMGVMWQVGWVRFVFDWLCCDGRCVMQIGIVQVGVGRQLLGIGNVIGSFVKVNGYMLICNFVSYGVGQLLYEYLEEIVIWFNCDWWCIEKGLVLMVELFLLIGGFLVIDGDDGWMFYSEFCVSCVQYEYIVVVIDRGVIIVMMLMLV